MKWIQEKNNIRRERHIGNSRHSAKINLKSILFVGIYPLSCHLFVQFVHSPYKFGMMKRQNTKKEYGKEVRMRERDRVKCALNKTMTRRINWNHILLMRLSFCCLFTRVFKVKIIVIFEIHFCLSSFSFHIQLFAPSQATLNLITIHWTLIWIQLSAQRYPSISIRLWYSFSWPDYILFLLLLCLSSSLSISPSVSLSIIHFCNIICVGWAQLKIFIIFRFWRFIEFFRRSPKCDDWNDTTIVA